MILVANPLDVSGHPRIVPYSAITGVRAEAGYVSISSLSGELLDLRVDFERLVEAMAQGLAYDARQDFP